MADTPSNSQPVSKPRTYCWLASLAAPVIGLVLEALSTYGHNAETIGWLGFVLCLGFGLFACLDSFKKKEPLRWVSLISGIPSALALIAFVVMIVWALCTQTGARHF